MASFSAAPRVGHLEWVKRIVGYLVKMKHGFIHVCTEEPDFSDLPQNSHDWSRMVCGEVHEDLPSDAPPPLGK